VNEKSGLENGNLSLGETDKMDINPQIADLGIRLGETIARNTAGAIFTKIQAVKAKNADKETIHELEEIINSLQSDRSELIQIAQAYEQEFVAQQISPEDIEYITTSFIPVLKDLIEQNSSGENSAAAASIETIDRLTPLLSVEMLTVLQLVGFNFKKAIGEPLTLLLQKAITSKVPADPQSNIETNKLALAFNTELLKVAQDKDAADRLERLRSNGII
jgi:hypothetical protein